MFTTFIVQPIFNLLTTIYALLPGHNFGLAIIVFTIVVRLLMWPLVKKQLHQAKAMRKLQPELKKIKKAAGGDRRQESLMQMELYKERGINPFASLGPLLLQLPIFIGLYIGLQKVVRDPQQIIDFSYTFLHSLPGMQALAANINLFDATLLGVVDLTRPALGAGGLYIPAMIIVVTSVVIQYYQAKQLQPVDKDARKLRDILKDAQTGKQADQSELNAAVSRSMRILLPAMIFIFTVGIASALSLYWLTSGLVAYLQQRRVLNKDDDEMTELADKPDVKAAPTAPKPKITKSGSVITVNGKPTKDEAAIPEAAIVAKPKQTTKKKTGKGKKRRK